MPKIIIEPEFSRPLPVEKVIPKGAGHTIRASEPERQKLAERFGLLKLDRLEAVLQPELMQVGHVVKVTGHFTADATQQCVVTLEPIETHLEQPVEGLFANGEMQGGSFLIGPDALNLEPIADGVIDLGELVAQHLGAALDPYPRKPDAVLVEAAFGGGGPAKQSNVSPFARLADLKGKPKK